MIGKLSQRFGLGVPTPTVRWVRCSTVARISLPNQSDRDNYAHLSDRRMPHQYVNLDAGR